MTWVLAAIGLAFASTASAQSGADLSITLTNNDTSLTRGSWFNYEFSATNTGPSPADGVEITYTIPAAFEQMTFSGISGSGWTCSPPSPGNPVLSCTRASAMPVGETVSAIVGVRVKSDASGSVANTIAITATTQDPNPANNTAMDTDPVIIPSTVPTLTEWAMILFAALLAGAAALTLQRRRRHA